MNHVQARDLLTRTEPDLTPAESQFARSVMSAETSYAGGWVNLAKKLGVESPEQYAGVNNFGAITAPRPTPETAFFMRDRWWRKYGSPELGIKDAVRTILKPNVRKAVNAGDGAAAVRAMGANGYFIEPNIAKAKQVEGYRKFIANSHLHVINGTGEPSLLRFDGQVSGIGDLLTVGCYLGGVIGAIWLFSGGAEKHE